MHLFASWPHRGCDRFCAPLLLFAVGRPRPRASRTHRRWSTSGEGGATAFKVCLPSGRCSEPNGFCSTHVLAGDSRHRQARGALISFCLKLAPFRRRIFSDTPVILTLTMRAENFDKHTTFYVSVANYCCVIIIAETLHIHTLTPTPLLLRCDKYPSIAILSTLTNKLLKTVENQKCPGVSFR